MMQFVVIVTTWNLGVMFPVKTKDVDIAPTHVTVKIVIDAPVVRLNHLYVLPNPQKGIKNRMNI